MKSFRQVLIFSAGVLLILVGIAGLFLPVIQGWLMIFLGLSLIAPRFAERLKRRFFRKFFKNDLILIRAWKKEDVEAGFTTRCFPLVLKNSEELLSRENQHAFLRHFASSKVAQANKMHIPDKIAFLRQVHGSEVKVFNEPKDFPTMGFYPVGDADGAITNIPGLTLLVFSADCLPIFFECGGWVGLVHAGWRGTRDRIAAQAARLLRERSGLGPGNIRAFFGPSIGRAHYEVGGEFKSYFRASSLLEKKGNLYFDLARENETQLARAGVRRRSIANLKICTVDENDSFYSFRKEGGHAGRTISFITKLWP